MTDRIDRRRSTPERVEDGTGGEESPSPRPAGFPHVIDPRAVYTLESARSSLGLARGCLPREIRLRRLRASKRAGRYFLMGSWLIEWLEAGEIRRSQPAATENGTLPEQA
jgi:hypothetical protein